MKLLIADKQPESVLGALSDLGYDVTYSPSLGAEDLPSHIADNRALIVRSTKVTAQTLDAGSHLQVIIRAGAGTNTIDCAGAAARGIFVANCPGKNAIAVAELTLGLILSLDRHIPENVADLKNRQWNKAAYSHAQGLYGRTLGIIGLGGIGREVAQRAQAFGMDVKAWSRSLTDEEAHELDITRCSTVLELCGAVDVVSVHVPLTESTQHLIGEKEIASMRNGAFLINMARGGVVDDDALLRAVTMGHIRAASDVFEIEPKQSAGDFESPLGQIQGFHGTHHIGAATRQAQRAVADEVVRILGHWKATGSVLNCVNLSQETVASGQLLVRHLDRVGVLATVLDVLKQADINVKEMHNAMFEGAFAACAKITVEQTPSESVIQALQGCSEHVLGVVWIPR